MIGRDGEVVARASILVAGRGGAYCRTIPPELMAYPCHAIQLCKLLLTNCNHLKVRSCIGQIPDSFTAQEILAWLRLIEPCYLGRSCEP